VGPAEQVTSLTLLCCCVSGVGWRRDVHRSAARLILGAWQWVAGVGEGVPRCGVLLEFAMMLPQVLAHVWVRLGPVLWAVDPTAAVAFWWDCLPAVVGCMVGGVALCST
jgi:hypothetical protein